METDEWDLYDYDDWDDWAPGAREQATDDAMLAMREGKEPWSESDDEPRFIAALLYAGAEPENPYHDEHQAWQARAAVVLMQKYRKHWWFEPSVRLAPEYRHRAATCRRNVQVDELRKFYTWVCKQRGEPWTDTIVPSE